MKISQPVKTILETLQKKGFDAFVVGGCVRDVLRKQEPQDWDIATSANPEQISKLFKQSFINNDFGTVTVVTNSKKPALKEIEVTPFRIEEGYTDKRHPDKIKWAKTINEDLSRRDFTINAIAADINAKITDPFAGQKDLAKKIIRAVGKPEHRFNEDALRLMRAVRFSVTLGKGWKIEPKTLTAIKKNKGLLQAISKERIRDELMKIVMCDQASEGIELLRQTGLLKYIMSELEEGYKVAQSKHHTFDCYEHSILSLKYAAKKKFNKYVRLASLLHDIAKPRVKRGQGEKATFFGHEVVGARITAQILTRLRFSRRDIEKVVKLVRFHLFYYNVDEVTEASVRKLVRSVGPESIEELLQVRQADRIGSGVPKAEPYKLRHLKYVIEKVSQDPISVLRLKVSGDDIMKALDIKPGCKVGQILDVLLGYVLEDPAKNTKVFLKKEIAKMGKLSDKDLQELSKKAREERNKVVTKRDEMTKKKYWVT